MVMLAVVVLAVFARLGRCRAGQVVAYGAIVRLLHGQLRMLEIS